jgi:TAG lipase/steryl ester hydrolase/phospholipase A2/LPA acyltransferase
LIGNFPLVKTVTWDVFETIFAPNAVAKQLALAVALETGMVSVSKSDASVVFTLHVA